MSEKRTTSDVSKEPYGDVKTGQGRAVQNKSKGYLVTDWMTSGMEVA